MKVFWRTEQLNDAEKKLLDLCLEAHAASVHRDNISTVVLRNAVVGSMSYMSAIAAALCSCGGVHAPIQQTRQFLDMPMEHITRHITVGGRVPGWGCSFSKDGIDPTWQPVFDHIEQNWPEFSAKIGEITEGLHKHGKPIHPNPACLTAATAMILEIPPQISEWLFIHGRLIEWSKITAALIAGVHNNTLKEAS